MSLQRDILEKRPDPGKVAAFLKRILQHGSQSKITEFLRIKRRQYFAKHFLGVGDEEGGVIYEALLCMHAIAVKDFPAFIALAAYFNSFFAIWSDQADKQETVDALIGEAMQQAGELLVLRTKPGTSNEQAVAASRLLAAAKRIPSMLDESSEKVVSISSRRAG